MVIEASDVAPRVRTALAQDKRTQDANIDVSATGGSVTLTGTVRSREIKEAAEEIAKAQSGVATVVNDIRIG